MVILFYFIFIIYLYNIFITLFSFNKKERKSKIVDDKNNSIENTFCILIAAHNEEDVIYDTLSAIKNTDYKSSLYNIYVIADNCTDNTLKKVSNFKDENKNINCEIIEVSGGGKPHAINAGILYLKDKGLLNNDNIIILDADNKISPTLLKSFNSYHKSGYKLLQCRIASMNDTSFISNGFTSAFNTMSEGFQYARNQIGLSASLSGTGFSINRDVFNSVGFENCNTLTEDLEFSILSILNGYKIKFIGNDYVLNQNLDHLKPSIIQRLRWCRGHMQVSVKLSKAIIIKFFKKPSFQLLDSFFFINTPSKTVLYTLSNFLFILNHEYIDIPFIFMLILLIYNLFFILYCNNFKIKYLLAYFFYGACMYFIIIVGTITFKKTEWVKTKHIKINDSIKDKNE